MPPEKRAILPVREIGPAIWPRFGLVECSRERLIEPGCWTGEQKKPDPRMPAELRCGRALWGNAPPFAE